MSLILQNSKALISGFEPFAGDQYNPSGGYVDYLNSSPLFKHRAIKLPVTYSCYEILKKQILEYKPNVVVMLGLAKEREHISIETNCYNKTNTSLKDENEQFPNSNNVLTTYQEIINSQNSILNFSKEELNIKQLSTNLSIFDKLIEVHKVELSTDPGLYICNFIYFLTLFETTIKKKFNPAPLVIFIHLPATQEIKVTGWKKEDLFQKLNELLNIIFSN